MDLLHLARTAAEAAGDYIRSVDRPRDPGGWTIKGQRDFVTEVDRSAERIITDVLIAAAPDSRIVGEELSPEVVSDGLVWIVDPLDGTTNFLHDYPAYAVSIAAAIAGRLMVGVVLNIPRRELFTASLGGGAWCGDRRLSVSSIDEPGHSLIGTGFPFKDLSQLGLYQRQFARVTARVSGIRRAGSAALDLADVAAGRFDAFWEQHLSAWDHAAGTLLIREAGGTVTDLHGRQLGARHSAVVAGSPAMHAWLLATLREPV